MDILRNKVAVITGATSGLGVDVAREFIAEGAQVVLAGRRRSDGEAVAAQLGAAATFVRTDVSVESEVAALLAFAVDRHGRLDVLVNNAGTPSTLERLANVDAAAFRQTHETNVMGPLYGIKHAVATMREQGSGSIINVASFAGERVAYAGVSYSVSKAALIHLSRWAAVELGEYGIRVNSLSPGFINTGRFGKAAGLTEEQARTRLAALDHHMLAMTRLAQGLRRTGTGVDVAGAAVFLASDASAFVTGQDLQVDGGLARGQSYAAMIEQRTGMNEVLRGTTADDS